MNDLIDWLKSERIGILIMLTILLFLLGYVVYEINRRRIKRKSNKRKKIIPSYSRNDYAVTMFVNDLLRNNNLKPLGIVKNETRKTRVKIEERRIRGKLIKVSKRREI